MKKAWMGVGIIAALLAGIIVFFLLALSHGEGNLEAEIGHTLGYWTVIPFVAILLCIAILPLAVGHWWEHNLHRGIVSFLCALPVFLYFIFSVDHGATALVSIFHEYYSFIILLAALFTISGGIYLDGDLRATPLVNTIFLAVGGIIASFIGTTGAAMLLIRPLLHTNSERHHVRHIYIFFIFVVANVGGALLPTGDPPLFMGFLRGVPFFWTLRLWVEWFTMLSILLAVFFVWDTLAFRKESLRDKLLDMQRVEPLRLYGKINFLLLGGVIASVVFLKEYEGMAVNLTWFREPVMIGLAILSYMLDRRRQEARKNPDELTPRERNKFTFAAIVEVAVLFAGIFVTMLPAICLLKANGASFGINQPWQFFWLAGTLSSFLDNAPTYVTFMSLGQGLNACVEGVKCVAATGVPESILIAISIGAVFMGANTYIGNAPNFMVKSIVEEAGVKMPSFGGYMLYSIGILIPLFGLITLIFLI